MDELKKVLLAGIGLTSMTLEKADGFVKDLVAKGRLTVEEGRELQSELKRKSQAEAKEVLEKFDQQKQQVQYASKEDVARLEGKLDALLKRFEKED
ncbi:phasin family protein [Streptococcus sp. H49]|uniref:phasin family protein n=1 Tax=Streptococcus huangxiaojuni TaxID=3237239 RepID=UPI0034A2C062